ncbi:hypothetical protein B0T16DRAFT_20377 [Cercophora newfieldiana]|uniref:Uncharacterized protein n=1 Tax=Cercophora newfieldiana TaxID=92897 RepID=A0AA39YQC7_9PEZI|nr:hypothetical protein B0T16DRAFT_20377 [Cercophora newfieldiana]
MSYVGTCRVVGKAIRVTTEPGVEKQRRQLAISLVRLTPFFTCPRRGLEPDASASNQHSCRLDFPPSFPRGLNTRPASGSNEGSADTLSAETTRVSIHPLTHSHPERHGAFTSDSRAPVGTYYRRGRKCRKQKCHFFTFPNRVQPTAQPRGCAGEGSHSPAVRRSEEARLELCGLIDEG